MPHPKNRLKLTGDTHLPDVGLDLDLDDEPIDVAPGEEEVRVYADGYLPAAAVAAMPMATASQPMAAPRAQGVVGKLEREMERQASRTPLLAIGAALFVGWLLARKLRH